MLSEFATADCAPAILHEIDERALGLRRRPSRYAPPSLFKAAEMELRRRGLALGSPMFIVGVAVCAAGPAPGVFAVALQPVLAAGPPRRLVDRDGAFRPHGPVLANAERVEQ